MSSLSTHSSSSPLPPSDRLSAAAAIAAAAETLSSKVFAYDAPFSTPGPASTKTVQLQVRSNALALPLGYLLSSDADRSSPSAVPRSVLAPAGALPLMRRALADLSREYERAGPVVFHVNSADYVAVPNHSQHGDGKSAPISRGALISNCAGVLTTAADTGVAVMGSSSPAEVHHMSALSTALSHTGPAIHLFDGVATGPRQVPEGSTLDEADILTLYQALIKASPSSSETETDAYAAGLFGALNSHAGTDYAPFEYAGHEAAEAVLVAFGGSEVAIAKRTAKKLVDRGVRVGIVSVRLYRPFLEHLFLEILPKSVRNIAVVGQVHSVADSADPAVHSVLFADVLAAVRLSDVTAAVSEIKYFVPPVWTPDVFAMLLIHAARLSGSSSLDELLPAKGRSGIDLFDSNDEVHELSVWDVDTLPSPVPSALVEAFSSAGAIDVQTVHDNLTQGGTTRTDIRVSARTIDAPYPVQAAAGALVTDPALFTLFDIAGCIALGGILVIKSTATSIEEVEKIIPESARLTIAKKGLHLYFLADDADATAILAAVVTGPVASPIAEFIVPSSWADVSAETIVDLPTDVTPTDFTRATHDDDVVEEEKQAQQVLSLMQSFVFPESFQSNSVLRPDLSTKTSIVTVKDMRRLTPTTYDRNVFYIEFDLGTTGISYAIGEALGIHAQNDPAEVNEFIRWYGLDGDAVISIPTADGFVQTCTVYQALLQNIDIFGAPPKRFYEALAEFATDPAEKEVLSRLATPAGATEFKSRFEVDCVMYSDILAEFPSARPSITELAKIVSPMKRREYSIASSQRVTPTSVALLIVTVEWTDPKGRLRTGQSTRYLNALRVGDPVTVSVKASVMKLPTDPTAPIIMAGLGTGLAPFRAFVQERALQKAQGIEIGPVMLYLGARHQREEYLFGEEWEAYRDAGIITLLGCAFSRDQKNKIYIQDRMRETIAEIKDAYLAKNGSFYLCGPTWPVPDVTAVLQEAAEMHSRDGIEGETGAGAKVKVDGRRVIEEFKEAGRYVLEVY